MSHNSGGFDHEVAELEQVRATVLSKLLLRQI
jgi:hypothetical protein